jgi:cytochrome b561
MHWLMSLVIIGVLAVGLYMTNMPDSDQKWQLYGLHKSFGVLVLLLLIARVFFRFNSTLPLALKGISPVELTLSKIVIAALYLLMLIIPLSGYLMSGFGGYPISFFGITLPELITKNPSLGGVFHSMHGYAAYAIIGFIILHTAGALKHIFIDRINILRRMI